MDAFQGCYKFEPYDCRYWAAFYLFLRIALLTVLAVTQSGYTVVVGGILVIPALVMTAIIRPYREMKYNVIDVVLLSVFVQICFSAAAIALSAFNESFEGFFVFTLGVGFIIPFAYITVLSVHKILPKVCISYIKECAMNHLCRQIWYFRRGARDNHPPLEDSVEHEHSLLLHQENVMLPQPIY